MANRPRKAWLVLHEFIHSWFCSSVHLQSIHPSIHQTAHPSIHPFIHPMVEQLMHKLLRLFFSQSFNHFTRRSFTHPSTHPFTHPLTQSFVHSLIHSLNHSFIHSFTHSIIRSFTHSLTHPLNVTISAAPIDMLILSSRNSSGDYHYRHHHRRPQSTLMDPKYPTNLNTPFPLPLPVLSYRENEPGSLWCIAKGGYLPPVLKIKMGSKFRDDYKIARSVSYSGKIGDYEIYELN